MSIEQNTLEVEISAETNPHVENLLEERKAVDYLRRCDCKMLSELKEHLGENLRLQGILNDINLKNTNLNTELNRPVPKMKVLFLVFGVFFAVMDVIVSMLYYMENKTHPIGSIALLVVACILVFGPIIKKVVDFLIYRSRRKLRAEHLNFIRYKSFVFSGW